MLASLIVLGLAALAALWLTSLRASTPEKLAERRGAARALGLATGLQGLHFAEEATTGFQDRFPAVLGLPSIPVPVFVAFNLAWLAIWLASVPGVRAGRGAALFAAWFLAIAGMLNGIAHPILAASEAGYFPGLASSPLVGGASLWLWLRLRRATAPRVTDTRPPGRAAASKERPGRG